MTTKEVAYMDLRLLYEAVKVYLAAPARRSERQLAEVITAHDRVRLPAAQRRTREALNAHKGESTS